MQYTARLSRQDQVTLGATYSLGHRLNADPSLSIISQNPQTGIRDTTLFTVNNGLELPSAIGGGLGWSHRNQLKIGADYLLQQWSKTSYPNYTMANGTPQYVLTQGMFKDRHKFTFGGEFCQDANSRHFFQRMHYRIGASYATPYLKINGQDGPSEISVSAGFGIPIVNSWNNRSILNISAQWIKQDAKDFIKENTFRINIGLTFNERWFAKWKVQ